MMEKLPWAAWMRWSLNRKKQGYSILIPFLIAFQLGATLFLPAHAAEKIVVLQPDGLKAPMMQALLKTVQGAGYSPRVVAESDFLFDVKPIEQPVVLVPIGQSVSTSETGMLRRYVAQGGKVILLPTASRPDVSVGKLFHSLGLKLAGMSTLPKEESFQWKGNARPTSETLPAGSRVYMLHRDGNSQVLATWGSDYPAVVTSSKGALLNWQWTNPLSQTATTLALAYVMPEARPESFILMGQSDGAKGYHVARKLPSSSYSDTTTTRRNSDALIPLPSAASAPAVETSYPVRLSSKPARQIAQAEQAASSSERSASQMAQPSASQTNPVPTPSLSHPTQSAAKPAGPPPAIASAPTAIKTGTGKAPAPEKDTEAEVLQNILGGTAPPEVVDPAAGAGSGESGQQHYSFVGSGSTGYIAPSFDYGTYSFNMRTLGDYRRHINDALETSRQLSLDFPEEKVRNLLREAHQHKKRFESLYLSGQTQAGLDEFAEAKCITLQALALTTVSPRVEGRAIWLDRGNIVEAKNPEGMKQLMHKLHHAGINIVYLETVNAGFPIYPSAIAPQNPLTKGWDPVQAAVSEGHQLGMEVHAWVWAFAVGNRRHNPLIGKADDYPGPALVENGMMSEALRNRDGGLLVDGRQNEFWISPASARGRAYLLSVYKEIVSKYDVDGLQLDYIRYPFQTSATRMGYETFGRERFERATGLSLAHMDPHTVNMWTAWKTEQVSSFVEDVSKTLKAIRPNLILSAAVFPMKRESRIATIQQDWETWIDNGWIDTLSPMSYTTNPARLQGLYDYVQTSSRKRTLIYPGIAMHKLDGGQLVEQLQALRQHGGMGATLFAGSHLNAEKSETLGTGPFKRHESIPPHRDVVKSLQLILDDYRQKFEILKNRNGATMALSPEDMAGIETAIRQLQATLNAIQPVNNPALIPTSQLQTAVVQLTTLQQATDRWTAMERNNHPYRSQFFEQKMLILNELLSYLTDRSGSTGIASDMLRSNYGAYTAHRQAEPQSTTPAVYHADATPQGGGMVPVRLNGGSVKSESTPNPQAARSAQPDMLPLKPATAP